MTPRGLVVVGALLAVTAGAPAPAAVTDFYRNDRATVSLMVHLDRFGVVFPQRMPDSQRESIAASLGATIAERYPEGFAVLSLRREMQRDQLLAFLRASRDTLGTPLTAIGMIVNRPGHASPMIVTDRFTAVTLPGTAEGRMDSLNALTGAIVKRRMARGTGRSKVFQYLLEVPRDSVQDALAASRRYAMEPFVDYATPDFIHVIYARSAPTGEPMYPRQWHLSNDGSLGGTADADVDADLAWNLTMGREDVVVAVIDGGFDMAHEDWTNGSGTSVLWTNPGETCDGADNDDNGYVDDIHGWDYSSVACRECGSSIEEDCDGGPNEFRCGNLDLSCEGGLAADEKHGTSVAGIVAACGDNGKGGTGVAPGATLMFLRRTLTESDIAAAFQYAAANGASVINCSWNLADGQSFSHTVVAAIEEAASSGRNGKGCVIVFAMSNAGQNDCGETGRGDQNVLNITWSDGGVARDAVIAVSASNDKDQMLYACAGHGDCIDVLAPTYGGVSRIATTDHSGTNGYNSDAEPAVDCAGFEVCPDPPGDTTPDPGSFDPLDREPADRDYTYCFAGTSAAAPVVAGVAALVLSANPDLTQPQVVDLIRDTADKIDDAPGKGTGADYDPATGFSAGVGDGSSHGWGRVNAFEAVRVAAPASAGGRDGVDVFLRDNDLDWGNTEPRSSVRMESTRTYISYLSSVDIKVDAGPDFMSDEPETSAEFEAMEDEAPRSGETNRVYVRLRNRGPKSASNVTLKLLWAQRRWPLLPETGSVLYSRPWRLAFPTVWYRLWSLFPPLPADFWSRFPDDPEGATSWNSLGTFTFSTLPYSGSAAAKNPTTDAAGIARFEFTAPSPPIRGPNSYAFLAVADAGGADRPGPKVRADLGELVPLEDLSVAIVTPTDNNVTMKEFSTQK